MIPLEQIPAMQQWVYKFVEEQLKERPSDSRQTVGECTEYYSMLGAMRYCSDVLKNTKPEMTLIESLKDKISVVRIMVLVLRYREPARV